jgi:type II secretory pathway pseudopilin PulG
MTRRTTAVGWALPTISKQRHFLVSGAHPTRHLVGGAHPTCLVMPTADGRRPIAHSGITLVEMLIAMAITLVMMAAVVTLFANVSDSVRNRRATIELGGQLRHVRNVLQADLANATCPGLTWQRPDHNRGYIEIIEGQYREGNATNLIDADPSSSSSDTWPPTAVNPEIDHTTSIIPSSNLPFNQQTGKEKWLTDGAGLGDADDILMLTSRNEAEPFVGRVPKTEGGDGNHLDSVRRNGTNANGFAEWGYQTLSSPLAEVVWFSVENPGYTDDPTAGDSDPSANGFFGEPGMRTIYRRALLIAPWINPYRFVDSNGAIHDTFQVVGDNATFTAEPGLVRILPRNVTVAGALAALIAFQDRYDLSVRLEWDPALDSPNGRWKLVANTLGDLTKRENRFAHHGYRPVAAGPRTVDREYPYPVVSIGFDYSGGSANVVFVTDPEIVQPTQAAEATALMQDLFGLGMFVAAYSIDPENLNSEYHRYVARPFAYVNQASATAATARAMLNDDGEVVRVVHGLVPLWGSRRGEDVMLTDALAFDLRAYDPGAPLFGVREVPGSSTNQAIVSVLEPGDPGWYDAYLHADNMNGTGGTGQIGTGTTTFPFVGQGAYVDLGYGFDTRPPVVDLPSPDYATGINHVDPWFFDVRTLSDVYLVYRGVLTHPEPPEPMVYSQLAPGYAVYDTWSFHYENDGLNEDAYRFDGSDWVALPGEVNVIDEGTNGFDDLGSYSDGFDATVPNPRLGVDDIGERETAPPYDHPLRGAPVTLRAYERDSRQIRQATVRQQFMPE